ncbi:MAG: hypothetical protein IJX67_08960 [Oscillospiraceae bacterium]|nr:hypothetical protein [Oscillospiraceae bacterium]
MNLWEFFKDSFTGGLMDDLNLMLLALQEATTNIIESVFFIEESDALVKNGTLNSYSLSAAMDYLYLFMVGLVTLKLVWQGWKVYVLGRDGEAEVSPTTMLTNAVYAVGVALAFPVLYKIGVEIAIAVSSAVTRLFPSSHMWAENILFKDIPDLIMQLYASATSNVAIGILLLVYAVVFIILFFKMLWKGWQMLLYRLGFPFAVVGLVNSDGGVFKSYVQIYFQQLFIAMIQNFCLRISFALLSSSTGALSAGIGIFALIALFAAFSTPKIFAQILQQNGGGGRGTQIVYMAMMAARSFK